MKFAFRGASSAALILGLAGGFQAASAQQTAPTTPAGPQNQTVTTAQPQTPSAPAPSQADQTAQPADQTATDRVVVVGSLIATTPEDAPKPVEVYTRENLQNQGAPSVADFIRSLSSSAQSNAGTLGFGQASAENPSGSGFSPPDLRGLGPNATLSMVNGRRISAANGAFGSDTNTVPMEALESIEILKDGASATYGAGAVGGVINFRTRRDVDAPQFTYERSMYDGGKGGYKVNFLDGWVGDSSNLLITLAYEHEDSMSQTKRDYGHLPFAINPAGYLLQSVNPGRFIPQSSPFLTGTTSTVGGSVNDYRTAADCNAIGGVIVNQVQPNSLIGTGATAVANTACGFDRAPFQELVQENTTYRAFAEFNAAVSESMEVHFDVTYSKSESWTNRLPVDTTGAARAMDASIATGCASSCFYVIPVQVNTYTNSSVAPGGVPTATSVRNPFIDDFMARTGVTAAQLPNTGALYTSSLWRPFGLGGTPLTENGLGRQRFQRERVLINAGVKGKLGDGGLLAMIGLDDLLKGVTYDLAAQYNEYLSTNRQPDIIVARLQAALMGYGGPNCNAVDRVPTDFTTAQSFNRTIGVQSDTAPGTNGCQWFNPFASGFSSSVANGGANPQSGNVRGLALNLPTNATARPTGWDNPVGLIDWMTANRDVESDYIGGIFDANFTGQLPEYWSLPGGEISWALGGQWRLAERRDNTYDRDAAERYLNEQKCPFPDPAQVNSTGISFPTQDVGSRGCATATGAFYGNGRVNIALNTPPLQTQTQALAYFGELQLPVLDNLNFSLSVRNESFNGGDVSGTIWSAAGKYDITDNFYFRGSYGTNFRAEAGLDLVPGETTQATTNALFTSARFGAGFQAQSFTTVAAGIQPEEDFTQNFGFGYQSDDILGGRLRASVDFFQADINGAIATTTPTNILTSVFGANTAAGRAAQSAIVGQTVTAGAPGTQYANCGASLIQFVILNAPCVTGTTTGNNLLGFDLFTQNGPGFVSNGIDYSADYSHPLFDGDLSFQMTATQNLVYKYRSFEVNGVLFTQAVSQLGYLNQSRALGTGSGALGLASPSTRWKANGTVRWANDTHNINLRVNWQSGLKDERFDVGTGLVPIISDNPATTTVSEERFSTYGVFPKDRITFDLVYIYTAPFWEDLEIRAQVVNLFDKDPMPGQFLAGYTGTGDPRGRTFTIAATKKF